MATIIDENACDSLNAPVHPVLWTAVIPAAGKGSRLGCEQPKILFPLLGRTILDWLLDALRPVCSSFVVVLSPAGRAAAEPVLHGRLGSSVRVVIQERPLGMGDAVLCADGAVQTKNTLVVWGDQVTLSSRTVARCASLHENEPAAVLTLPTILKPDPYIHFSRDDGGRIVRVLQAREEPMPTGLGESDCGLFLFSTAALFSTLRSARMRHVGVGASTGEFNLVQVLPEFEMTGGAVQTLRIADPDETLGINTIEDVEKAETILRSRRT